MTPKHKKFFRLFMGLIIGLMIIGVMAFNTLLLWVATGPRALSAVTPYIEKAFTASDGSYRVKVAETWLIWDGWKHPIDIRLRDVSVVTGEGQVFSTFPEIAVGMHLPSLLVGRVLPTSIGLDHPVISLLQNEDGSISFGFQKKEVTDEANQPTAPFAALIDPLLTTNRGNQLRKMRSVEITNADVSVGKAGTGVFFEAREVDFAVKRNRKGVVEMLTSAKVRYGDYQSPVSARIILDKSKPTIDGNFEFQGVELSTLAKLFAGYDELSAVTVPISGRATVSVDKSGVVTQGAFLVDGGVGKVESPHLSSPITIDWIHMEGTVANNAQTVEISKLAGQIEGMPIGGAGKIVMSGEDVGISGEARIKDVTVDKLPMLWPPALAPLTREWVTTNITEGKVPEASVVLNILPGDLKKPLLPKEAVDANIRLESGKIRYIPEHPEVHNVNALIHVDGMELDAKVESATYLKSTKINSGRVLIEDLNPDNPYLKIDVDVDTSAKDAVHFLGLPRLKHADRLNLKESDIEGSVKGVAALGFYFFETPENEITFDIKADVTGISQPGFMKKFDIVDGNGSIVINNKSLEFKGKGTVNGATASNAQVTYLFTPEGGLDTFIEVTAHSPASTLPRFGYPNFDFVKGTLGVNAKLKIGDALEFSEASIDLANASVDAKSIGWSKPDKEPATLDIKAEKKDGKTAITSFTLKGSGMEASGSATLSANLGDIAELNLTKLQLGKTSLNTLNYTWTGSAYAIEAEGSSLDLSGYMAEQADKEPNFSFEKFPGLHLKADIKRVLVAAGQEISGFKGEVHCEVICSSANVNGKIGEKPFDFRIMKNPKGKRQLSLHAENAGAFLKAMNIYDKMEGGDLTITGNYDEIPGGSVLRARLDISDHMIRKAPVLAKILSLASLTGFIDTLEGNGIRFNKLMATFTINHDVIQFDRAKAYGPAVGITAKGTLTMPAGTFDLDGTVVPSYTLNSVVGKVPIIGQILTGGEGKGVFAANYSVKGTYNDPKVSVNPLSMLTPGFLREIFE